MKVKLTGLMQTGQLRPQIKRLLGNQFARRGNSRLATRVITISKRDILLYFEKKEEEKINTEKENPTYSVSDGGSWTLGSTKVPRNLGEADRWIKQRNGNKR